MHSCGHEKIGCVQNKRSGKLIVFMENRHFEANFCPFCGYQPERSKREDLLDLNVEILNRALKRAHKEGAWDQDDYDQMYSLVQKYKDAVL